MQGLPATVAIEQFFVSRLPIDGTNVLVRQ
jgi:hypothetical protein